MEQGQPEATVLLLQASHPPWLRKEGAGLKVNVPGPSEPTSPFRAEKLQNMCVVHGGASCGKAGVKIIEQAIEFSVVLPKV